MYEFKIVFGNVTLDVVKPVSDVNVAVLAFVFAVVVPFVMPVPEPIPVLLML